VFGKYAVEGGGRGGKGRERRSFPGVKAPQILEVIEVARGRTKKRKAAVQAMVVEVEPSPKHEGLRWLRLEGFEYPFALWDSVFEGDLSEGDTVELEYVPVEDRNFAKVVRLGLPSVSGNPKPRKSEPERFSKTEIGLMASVALKVAGHLVAAHVQQGKLTPGKAVAPMLDLADQIYDWLAQKRVEELKKQRRQEAEDEGAG